MGTKGKAFIMGVAVGVAIHYAYSQAQPKGNA